MALQPTGDYVTTLQERRDRLSMIGIAPAALEIEALADDTALSATYDDDELALLLNAQAAAINALLAQVEALRAVLIESDKLAAPAED